MDNLNELPATGQTAAIEYNKRAESFLSEAKSFVVDSHEMADMAATDLRKIKTYAKEVDEKRKSITKPLDEVKKSIMDLFRPATEYLEKAESVLKVSLKNWMDAEEKKRREAEAIARKAAKEEAERLAAEAKAAAEKGDVEQARALEQQSAMAPAAALVQEQPQKLAGISKTEVWKFEITNVADIPREYLIVDESKIRKVVHALKAETNIPGIRVYSDTQIGARAA